ncbi:MAG: folate-binding protein YgfZ [Deltaproteobacteria bacterium]|nr:folate-binding protein YgfZ [Deltaproteobacteria bacterium]MBW1875472.1 folate-binding protein YgfZ [Deltaproteobacteria bacterium]MBW2210865.1 folate-binding protein YgfZ [Deltaproteobacteria bacterium]MBW2213582.1 folate-binding protein YgfZ [Deltaproteobacteria bacterium]MBW2549959.1 folate-binding protein YgfZ [Deltaproteobacteria bacterium]
MAHARELHWLQHTVGVLSLSDRAIISVGGDDAREWLQGQLTNQVEGVEPGDSLYAFVLTLKGRILADVYALVREDDMWLDVPANTVDALLERFDHYIIMEDVDLAHRDDLRVITAQGPVASEVAEGGWPADRLGVGGRQWVVTHAELESELERLTQRGRELDGGWVSNEAWEHAHVVRGRPLFGVDFGDWTYPQETGLNPLAVSFNKGCYIGQETVVMLENRGKAPKVLWRWTVETTEPPSAKAPISLAGTVVGEVTSAVAERDGASALGFLKRGCEVEGSEGFTIDGAPARAIGTVEAGPGVCPPRT